MGIALLFAQINLVVFGKSAEEERQTKKLCRAPQQFAFSPPDKKFSNRRYHPLCELWEVGWLGWVVGGDLMEIDSTIGTMKQQQLRLVNWSTRSCHNNCLFLPLVFFFGTYSDTDLDSSRSRARRRSEAGNCVECHENGICGLAESHCNNNVNLIHITIRTTITD